MGVDYNVYIGPYAEVVVKTAKKTIDHCKDPKNCPTHHSTKFCSQCGIEVEKRFKIMEFEEPDLWEVEEKFYSALANIEREFPEEFKDNGVKCKKYRFIPNGKRDGSPERTMSFDAMRDKIFEDWLGLDIKYEVNWFTQAYKLELFELEKACGSVRIGWGCLQFCS